MTTSRVALDMLWNCSESAPKLQSYLTSNKQQTSIWNCSQNALKMLSKCSQNAPKLLPNRSQTALKPAQTELIINELTVNLNEMNSTMKRL